MVHAAPGILPAWEWVQSKCACFETNFLDRQEGSIVFFPRTEPPWRAWKFGWFNKKPLGIAFDVVTTCMPTYGLKGLRK